jgi:glutathione synthase/RimK-type ligase-like ATP-grasp enzyme
MTVDWPSFDLLIIRSTWDYYLHFEAFEKWLMLINNLNITLCNTVEIISENSHKFYLKNLQKKGVQIIPTEFLDKTDHLDLSLIHDKDWQTAIIKPAVSAGSFMTEKFNKKDILSTTAKYTQIVKTCDLLVQKFMPEIELFGEVSLIFFGGVFSHAVKKMPHTGDFRVQVQFGGQYARFSPKPSTLQIAENILNTYTVTPIYARIDGIETASQFYLMEVELIEPDLYFNIVPEAKGRFVDCVLERYSTRI